MSQAENDRRTLRANARARVWGTLPALLLIPLGIAAIAQALGLVEITSRLGRIWAGAIGLAAILGGAFEGVAPLTRVLVATPAVLELWEFGLRRWTISMANLNVVLDDEAVPCLHFIDTAAKKDRGTILVRQYDADGFQAFANYVDVQRRRLGVELQDSASEEEEPFSARWLALLFARALIVPGLIIIALIAFHAVRDHLSPAEIAKRTAECFAVLIGTFTSVGLLIWGYSRLRGGKARGDRGEAA